MEMEKIIRLYAASLFVSDYFVAVDYLTGHKALVAYLLRGGGEYESVWKLVEITVWI
jgi:hypothetical protein